MEERVLHYLIVWLLCPRGSNLAQCFEIDLMIMSAITQNIKINWADLISDTIVRAKRYDRGHLPYPLLISLICVYKGVDVTGEKSLTVLRNHEIEESTLHQMGFIRQGNMFVRAEDDIAQEEEASAEEDEDIPLPHPTNVAGPSHPPQEYSLEMTVRPHPLFLRPFAQKRLLERSVVRPLHCSTVRHFVSSGRSSSTIRPDKVTFRSVLVSVRSVLFERSFLMCFCSQFSERPSRAFGLFEMSSVRVVIVSIRFSLVDLVKVRSLLLFAFGLYQIVLPRERLV
ncbi:hypothetical protein LR48_Vigan97s001100 [Vigna angularis]|uniref:Uncharacterized protein n=1 Tax=Phaseolus angularis TaxID=3914 RepID=A0A0L9T4N7_PHAAN|nr:hypothetical protein LR48_Vigan97s001100 [Vigna angularis]